MNAYFTELPVDEFGNRGHTNSKPRVIEGTIEGELIRVISPKNYPWTTLELSLFVEVEGPARELTEEEYIKALEKAGVDPAHITSAKRRIGL